MDGYNAIELEQLFTLDPFKNAKNSVQIATSVANRSQVEERYPTAYTNKSGEQDDLVRIGILYFTCNGRTLSACVEEKNSEWYLNIKEVGGDALENQQYKIGTKKDLTWANFFSKFYEILDHEPTEQETAFLRILSGVQQQALQSIAMSAYAATKNFIPDQGGKIITVDLDQCSFSAHTLILAVPINKSDAYGEFVKQKKHLEYTQYLGKPLDQSLHEMHKSKQQFAAETKGCIILPYINTLQLDPSVNKPAINILQYDPILRKALESILFNPKNLAEVDKIMGRLSNLQQDSQKAFLDYVKAIEENELKVLPKEINNFLEINELGLNVIVGILSTVSLAMLVLGIIALASNPGTLLLSLGIVAVVLAVIGVVASYKSYKSYKYFKSVSRNTKISTLVESEKKKQIYSQEIVRRINSTFKGLNQSNPITIKMILETFSNEEIQHLHSKLNGDWKVFKDLISPNQSPNQYLEDVKKIVSSTGESTYVEHLFDSQAPIAIYAEEKPHAGEEPQYVNIQSTYVEHHFDSQDPTAIYAEEEPQYVNMQPVLMGNDENANLQTSVQDPSVQDKAKAAEAKIIVNYLNSMGNRVGTKKFTAEMIKDDFTLDEMKEIKKCIIDTHNGVDFRKKILERTGSKYPISLRHGKAEDYIKYLKQAFEKTKVIIERSGQKYSVPKKTGSAQAAIESLYSHQDVIKKKRQMREEAAFKPGGSKSTNVRRVPR